MLLLSNKMAVSILVTWCIYIVLLLIVVALALSIHHVRKSKTVKADREVHVLKMKLQEIMKG